MGKGLLGVILLTPLFHRYSSPYTYTDFIDSFVHPVMTMLTGSPPPIISQEIKRVLQLSKQSKVEDWYLYQNHIKIRIYGCQLAPYKLPKYLPIRLFALEYYRQIMNYDNINFVSTKNTSQFKVKN